VSHQLSQKQLTLVNIQTGSSPTCVRAMEKSAEPAYRSPAAKAFRDGTQAGITFFIEFSLVTFFFSRKRK
jgi:hypothetical protein